MAFIWAVILVGGITYFSIIGLSQARPISVRR
jgi:hypothetical protein